MLYTNNIESNLFFASILAGLFPLMGGIILYINQLRKIQKAEPFLYKQTNRNFYILILLIFFFILGYSTVLIDLKMKHFFNLQSLVGPIFFFGSLFVLTTALLTTRIFGKLMRSRDALKKQAYHDFMTKLPNRRMLTEKFNELSKYADAEKNLSVAFIDIQNFKKVNDRFGHHIGDTILIQIAKRLQDASGSDSMVCRIGGDDFVILFNRMTTIESIKNLRAIRTRLLEPYSIEKTVFNLNISYGIDISSGDLTPDERIKRANMAMRRSKMRGKNIITAFSNTIKASIYEILQFESDFNAAIKNDSFELVYQPQFDLKDRPVLSGFEALARWNHPQRGNISPMHFITMAERYDLITGFDRYILDKSCRMWAECRENNSLCDKMHLSVNISAKHITDPLFINTVKETLECYNLPPDTLYIELTESAFVSDPDIAAASLEKLNSLGVHCAIDDFGTGYSSLTYLSKFPTQSLKIDKSFISKIEDSESDRDLVESIINFAHILGIKAVAEGVETKSQLEILTDMQCDTVQGYYLSRPLTQGKAKELLEQQAKE